MRIAGIGRAALLGTLVALGLIALPPHGGWLHAQVSTTSITSSSGPVEWDHGPVVAGQVTNLGVQDVCPPLVCDNHDLTVILPAPAATFYTANTATLTIKFTWTSSAPTDIDLFAISPAAADHGPGAPDGTFTGPGEETLTITDPLDGLWHIRATAALSPLPTAVHAVATLTTAPKPTSPIPPPSPHGAPTFVNYAAPEDCPPGALPGTFQSSPSCITPSLGSTTSGQHDAGEPSIGVNWKSGKVFIEAGNHTLRVAFDDTQKPATAVWSDQRSPFARVSLDPILFTDEDGANWTPTQGSGQPAGVDHQTVGGGPYASPVPITKTSYPHAIYYCSQDVVTAFCSRSDDGGLTFGPGVPIYTFANVNGVDKPIAPGTCGGLHGHVRVSPDGTVYVPNNDCFDDNGVERPGVAVSTDNGLTWVVRTVPDGTLLANGGSDPSVAAGANNTIYFGYANGDGHAKITVSRDRGQHWTKSADAGTPFGIQNTEFAEVIAGDDDRAAFAFLGTTTKGDTQAADFLGVWHLYAAFTYDGGKSWTTADATPADPVQRGCIWNGGGDNPCRNLLDFNDITVDRTGRVLVGFADGCTGTCVTDATQNASTGPATAQDALATISRQVGGRGLFAAFDGTQFGTKTGDNKGGGPLCYGDAATGVHGDPVCYKK